MEIQFPKEEEKVKETKTAIQENFELVRSIYASELTIEEYHQAYQTLKNNEEIIKTELKSKKVVQLKNIVAKLGCYYDSRHKKQDFIDKIYDNFKSYFYIGRPVSYFLTEKTHDQAEKELIEGTTSEVLEEFYIKRREKKEAHEKAISNPKTLAEFREFINHNGKEALSQEQLEEMDKLKADITLRNQAKKEDEDKVLSKVDIKTAEFELHPTKHSKKGTDLFTVTMTERVDRETFVELRSKAKQFNGYYSRYSNRHANPPIKAGFQFEDEDDAKKFMGLTEESQVATKDDSERKEEVKLSASQRMRERAEAMIVKANESLEQDRTVNTHRQAGMAARANEKAENEIIFAKKLIAIADGLEDSTIVYLEKIRNGKQLEQLEFLTRLAYRNRVPYQDRKNVEMDTTIDVNHLEYPYPKYYFGIISDIFGKYDDTPGMKRDVAKIIDYSRRRQDKHEYVEIKDERIITLFKNAALKINDVWSRDRILDEIKNYERLQKMGLVNIQILRQALRELANLSKGAVISPEQKQAAEMKALEHSFIGKKIDGFFPTPKPLIDKMFEMAKVFEGETILEPSAGLGHIADAIKLKYPSNDLSVIEWNYSLWEALNKKGFDPENENFLSTTHKYDVIFMNPPFENNQDIDHVRHAFNLLKEGGRLVAIMAGNKNGSRSVITEFNDFVNEHGYMVDNEAGSFKSAFNSTNVNTVTVYLEK